MIFFLFFFPPRADANSSSGIRAHPNNGPQGFFGGINSAILRYSGAPASEPAAAPPPTPSNPFQETKLIPLDNPGAPGEPFRGGADVVLNLALGWDDPTEMYTINGASFIPPDTPVLLQILSGAMLATDLLPQGSVYVLPPNKVVEISIPAGVVAGPHPFHLHGVSTSLLYFLAQISLRYSCSTHLMSSEVRGVRSITILILFAGTWSPLERKEIM